MKEHTEQAAALLPCKVCDEPTNRYRGRWHRCPVKYRPAVAAALKAAEEKGRSDFILEAENKLAEKDERIAQLERSNEFIVRCFDEREKALADAYTRCGQLKERVAELEAERNTWLDAISEHNDRVAAAKIEGLKMARDLMNRLISIGDMIRIIDAEIAALEKGGK